MTLAHYLYIPGIFLLGLLVGYIVRDRVQGALASDASEREQREAAREARARARAKAGSDPTNRA